jgi:ribonuclease HIII
LGTATPKRCRFINKDCCRTMCRQRGRQHLHERLRKDTRCGEMRLEHRTKAESDVAVAAASILARDRFVGWLAKASQARGTTLPKGAGPQVITTARALVAAHGPGILREYAKVSFRTTRAVLKNTS